MSSGLYVIELSNGHIKVGRSIDIDRRITDLRRNEERLILDMRFFLTCLLMQHADLRERLSKLNHTSLNRGRQVTSTMTLAGLERITDRMAKLQPALLRAVA